MTDVPSDRAARRTGARWIGGAAALVMVLIAVVATTYLTKDDKEDTRTESADTTVSKDMCAELDVTGLADLFAHQPPSWLTVDDGQLVCIAPGRDDSSLTLGTWVSQDADEAVSKYEEVKGEARLEDDDLRELSGIGDVAESDIDEYGGDVVVRLDDMVFLASIYSPVSEEVDVDEAEAVVVTAVESMAAMASD